MVRTPSKSSSEATGNPASMTSTPRLSSWIANLSFSAVDIVAPGDCSPSLSVVSKIVILAMIVPALLRVLSEIKKRAPRHQEGPRVAACRSRSVRQF